MAKRSFKDLHDYELSQRFRSKADFVAYLGEGLQLYLPPSHCIGKDFLRQVFKNEKEMLKNSEVKHIAVPAWPELKMETVYEHYKDDAKLSRYLPDRMAKGRMMDRTWFWNVFATIYPEIVNEIIEASRKKRFDTSEEEQKAECIQISPEWHDQLLALPFKSREHGRTVYLLKAKAKPQSQQKKRKMYEPTLPPLQMKGDEPMKSEEATSSGHMGRKRAKPNFGGQLESTTK